VAKYAKYTAIAAQFGRRSSARRFTHPASSGSRQHFCSVLGRSRPGGALSSTEGPRAFLLDADIMTSSFHIHANSLLTELPRGYEAAEAWLRRRVGSFTPVPLTRMESALDTRLVRGCGLNDAKKSSKFWEESIGYFPLIRHGPHRRQRITGKYRKGKAIS
jgi:hypothetical protein